MGHIKTVLLGSLCKKQRWEEAKPLPLNQDDCLSLCLPPAPLPGRGSHGRAPPLARSLPARPPPGKVLGSGNKAWLGRELFARALSAAFPVFPFPFYDSRWVVPESSPPPALGVTLWVSDLPPPLLWVFFNLREIYGRLKKKGGVLKRTGAM